MNGENEVDPRSNRIQSSENLCEFLRIIDIGWPMQGHQHIAFFGQRIGIGIGQETDERIDHHISYQVNLLRRHAFAQ